MAIDLLRGAKTNPAFPPNKKAAELTHPQLISQPPIRLKHRGAASAAPFVFEPRDRLASDSLGLRLRLLAWMI